MPYADILKRSFHVLRSEPALWVLGFILALFGGGGGMNFSWNANRPEVGNLQGRPPLSPPPEWLTPAAILPVAALVLTALFFLMLLALLVRGVALAALIEGAERAAEGIDVHWRDLWRAGWSRRGLRVALLEVLLLLPVFLLVLVIGVAVLSFLVPVSSSLVNGIEPASVGIVGVVAAVGLLVALVALVVLATVILNLVAHYAARFIVLANLSFAPALRKGWQLFREHIAETIVLAVVLWLVGIVVGILIGIAMVLLGLGVGLPIFLILLAFDFPLLLTLLLGIPAFLLLLMLAAVLQGPLVAYVEAAWTLAWDYLTKPVPLVGKGNTDATGDAAQ